jgi:hypothetical protein
MDNFSAGQAHDERAFDGGPMLTAGEPLDIFHADDNLGDEAPFFSTWQHLAGGDAQHD